MFSLHAMDKLDAKRFCSPPNLIPQHTRVICNLGATETACLQRLTHSIDD